MDVREIIIREQKIKNCIEFNLTEMEMIYELQTLPKYQNSSTLKDRYATFEKETKSLLSELKNISQQISEINELATIINDINEEIEKEKTA